MPVIALAHPQEIRGEADRLAGVGPGGLDGPQIVVARPACRGDLVAIADVRAEIVLLDHLAHVGQDLGRGRDRRAGPGLEAIAEGVEVAVGADAGIAVGQPGAAEALLRFQHDEARAGALLGQVIGAADPGNAGARRSARRSAPSACCCAGLARVAVSDMGCGLWDWRLAKATGTHVVTANAAITVARPAPRSPQAVPAAPARTPRPVWTPGGVRRNSAGARG